MVLDKLELSRENSPTLAYPGFDLNGTYQAPSPQPRVKPEGEAYFVRNRGSIGSWIFDYYKGNYDSPRPIPRCPTSESFQNYKLSQKGTGVSRLINGEATPRPDTAPARITHEGEPIASLSRGKRMKVFINEYGKKGPTPRNPRITNQAKDHAEVHKGGRMNKLIHKYGRLPLSDRGVPRVKPEGEDNAELDRGKRMEGIVHREFNNVPTSSRDVPRVKPEGEPNANLDRGKRMDRLIHKYGRMPLSSRAVPRVKTEGDPNYKLDFGKRMATLVHDTKKFPAPSPQVPRVRSSDAKAAMIRNRGQTDRIMRETGRKTCVYKPGVQKIKYARVETV